LFYLFFDKHFEVLIDDGNGEQNSSSRADGT